MLNIIFVKDSNLNNSLSLKPNNVQNCISDYNCFTFCLFHYLKIFLETQDVNF